MKELSPYTTVMQKILESFMHRSFFCLILLCYVIPAWMPVTVENILNKLVIMYIILYIYIIYIYPYIYLHIYVYYIYITLWLLFVDGVQRSQSYKATIRRNFIFYHLVPKSSWYLFNQPQKDGRLSWPWSHPVLLNL